MDADCRVNARGGDTAYWYRRARKPVCKTSLDEEWEAIVKTLLAGRGARNGE